MALLTGLTRIVLILPLRNGGSTSYCELLPKVKLNPDKTKVSLVNNRATCGFSSQPGLEGVVFLQATGLSLGSAAEYRTTVGGSWPTKLSMYMSEHAIC